MPSWDADLYLRFAAERSRPAIDLISRLDPCTPGSIIDIGCGPGNSTELLRRRWPKAEIAGLDSSAEMLEKARKTHPDWRWIQGDAESWRSERTFDLVFSNAALQWVSNHADIFPRLLLLVAVPGALAVQMPSNFYSPVHRIMAEVSEDRAWQGAFHNLRRDFGVEPLANYYDLLQPLASTLELWETEYMHILPGVESILEWIRGTGMRPYLEALAEPGERDKFQKICLERFREAYPQRSDGRVLFPFRRIFMIAGRA